MHFNIYLMTGKMHNERPKLINQLLVIASSLFVHFLKNNFLLLLVVMIVEHGFVTVAICMLMTWILHFNYHVFLIDHRAAQCNFNKLEAITLFLRLTY